MKVSRELLEKYLEMWAYSEYGVPFHIAKERSRGSKMEFENLYRMLVMFANDLEKISKKLDDLVGDSPEEALVNDWMSYHDALENAGAYRRVGSTIEFTADFPPKGIDIKSDTITISGVVKAAEVIGWENRKEYR